MSADTRVYGLLGWPLEHTLSPALHAAAFRARGLDAIYLPFPVPPEALADAVRGVRALGIAGANVTVPHKQSVLALLDVVEPEARTIGAVNTIAREGGVLVGCNTDAAGLVRALEAAGAVLAQADVVVVGAGGAARAAVFGLARAGARRITIAARRADQAARLVRDLAAARGRSTLVALGLGAGVELREAFGCASLVVQATPATTGPTPASAAAFVRGLPLVALRDDALLVDLAYAPADTALLVEARRRGLRALGGPEMLLHQGALAFERWTGSPAPLDAMRAALSG